MFKKKGFTLVEMLVVLFIFSIIVMIVMDFFGFNNRLYSNISKSVDKHANARIAMEFLTSRIRDAKEEPVLQGGILDTTSGDTILTIDGTNSSMYLKIDGVRIYLENNIIKCDSGSQQAASNITSFIIKNKDSESKVYEVTVNSHDYSISTFIMNRK